MNSTISKRTKKSITERVLMSIHQMPKGLTAKLFEKAQGPYRIVRLDPNYTFELKRLSDKRPQIKHGTSKAYHQQNSNELFSSG